MIHTTFTIDLIYIYICVYASLFLADSLCLLNVLLCSKIAKLSFSLYLTLYTLQTISKIFSMSHLGTDVFLHTGCGGGSVVTTQGRVAFSFAFIRFTYTDKSLMRHHIQCTLKQWRLSVNRSIL